MDAPIDVTNIRIETPRLILRPWRMADLEDLYEYARVDGVGQMAGWQPHGSIEESRAILEMFIRERKTLALESREDRKVIGSLGLEPCYPATGLDERLQGREIGYVLSRDYWGRGLMPEAVEAVIDYCFRELNWDYLTCGHYNRNDRSRRVIEKCGFRYDRNFAFQTRLGTVEPGKMYVQYNSRRGKP
ncbi:MAG: GNAT family N-acetyltransferase [Oscillospiraceae bacterium]